MREGGGAQLWSTTDCRDTPEVAHHCLVSFNSAKAGVVRH